MNYLQRAVDLSRKSFEAGEFPAGAVLLMKNGNVYESNPSLAYYHGEYMVIDKAIEAEGYPLEGAVIYSSMEPCMMCSAKMYWAGITKVTFVIPKNRTNTSYAYEDALPMNEHIKNFNTKLVTKSDLSLLNEALAIYDNWVDIIESKPR